MGMRCVHGATINLNSFDAMGFDAFSANVVDHIFTLCDGANSCPNSGSAATWLSETFSQAHPDTLDTQLKVRHAQLCALFPETGSTLLRLAADDGGIHMASIGDSFLWLFQKPWGGFGPWRCIDQMPRDIDSKGHPTQLVGSEVCDILHESHHPPVGRYCAVMMSDGPGLSVSPAQLLERVAVLGRAEPQDHDLAYLCRSLALQAQKSGCRDDISVAIVWIHYQ